MARRTIRRWVSEACMAVACVVALVALCLMCWRGWRATRRSLDAGGSATREQEGERRTERSEADEGASRGGHGVLPHDRGDGTSSDPVAEILSAADATVHEETGEVEQVATRLLVSYRDARNCALAEAGYLDLLGSVWGCVVQGDGWVDVCIVEQTTESSCRVHVMRLDARETRGLLGVDSDDEERGDK